MSKLERKLAGDGLVITGELPVVDGGGIEAVRAEARAVRAVGRCRQRDRQHRRARARLQRRRRDRAQDARHGADPAGRLPRQEPPRDPGRHRRRRAARRREHLLPHRRRRHGRRREGGAPGLRPRRPAGDRHRGRDRARRVPLGPQDRAGAAPLHRRRREPGRAAAGLSRASARSRRRARARASCSCRSVTSPRISRRSAPSGRASGCSSARRSCPRSASSPARGRSSSWTPRCRASRCRRR